MVFWKAFNNPLFENDIRDNHNLPVGKHKPLLTFPTACAIPFLVFRVQHKWFRLNRPVLKEQFSTPPLDHKDKHIPGNVIVTIHWFGEQAALYVLYLVPRFPLLLSSKNRFSSS